MFVRECIPDVTLPRIRQGDDLAYWCRILPQVQHITYVNKPMYHYIVREGSQMASFNKESFELLADEFVACANAAKDSAVFDNIVASFFISLCVSQLPRYYAEDKMGAKAMNKALLQRLDKEIPNWRKAKAFTFSCGFRTRMKGLALWLCGKLFMHGMFGIYEAGMSFLQNKLHWKAKW